MVPVIMKIPEYGILKVEILDDLLFRRGQLLIPTICCWADENLYYGNLDGDGSHRDILDYFPQLQPTNVAFASEVSRKKDGVAISLGGGRSIEGYVPSNHGQLYMIGLLTKLIQPLGIKSVVVRE